MPTFKGLKYSYKKIQPVTIVKKAKKHVKKLRTVTFKPKQGKILPDRLSTKLPIQLWGTITSGGSGAGICYINLNTILTASNQGPLVAGNLSANRFTSAVAGAMSANNVSSATFPTGFQSLFSPAVGTASLFGRYTVVGLKYNIEFIPVASADDIILGLYPEKFATTTTVTTVSNLPEVLQMPYGKNKVISYIHSKKENTLSGRIDLAQYLGVTRAELLNDPAYSGTVDSSGITYPTEIVSLVLWHNNTRNVANTNAIPFRMTFTYDIVFSKEAGRLMTE